MFNLFCGAGEELCGQTEIETDTRPLNILILCTLFKNAYRLNLYLTLFFSVKLLSTYLWLYSHFVGPWELFSFLIFYTVGRTPWMGDQLVARPLPAHRAQHKQNKHTQTSMFHVGFEPAIPSFEGAKIVHALDCAATVIGEILHGRPRF
jgi:hypothetical protein